MTIEEAKAKMLSAGWACAKCSCPNQTGYDCAKKEYRGMIVELRGNIFKVKKRGYLQHTGYITNLETKLNELTNE